VSGYLKRLASALGAYQLADALGKLAGLALLPVYTGYIPPAGYGIVEVFATTVILVSIVVRLGMIEAFLRFHFAAADEAARDALARRASGFLLITTTTAAVALALFARPLSTLVLGRADVGAYLIAVGGLWAFTNLELAYGLLRVREQLRAYAVASLTNVVLTVGGSLALVVGLRRGADGLMAANYGATAVALVGVWISQRDRLRPARRWAAGGRTGARPEGLITATAQRRSGAERLSVLLRFGLPTVPAEVSVYLLSVIDRLYLVHARGLRLAGLYAIAVKFAGAIALVVRAFQYAWPPLAYSITDDRDAARLYGLITTYYVLVCGWIVAALALLGHWLLLLLVHRGYYGAGAALAWVALGWELYGLWVIFLAIAGRARVTTRNLPAALVGVAVNVGLLVALVGPLGLRGAGIALCGAYIAMLAAMHLLTRKLFYVQFEWRRLAQLVVVLGAVAGGGGVLLPHTGAGALAARLAVWLAIPLALYLTGFAHRHELAAARTLARRLLAGLPSATRQGGAA
jgi:O-antigen/teichoic acid export membrane protein